MRYEAGCGGDVSLELMRRYDEESHADSPGITSLCTDGVRGWRSGAQETDGDCIRSALYIGLGPILRV